MSSSAGPENETRTSKSAQQKKRIDKSKNFHAFKIKPEALSRQTADTTNKLTQPKQRSSVKLLNTSYLPKNTLLSAGKAKSDLAESNEKPKIILEPKKRQTLVDSYARVAATKNRTSKRLQDLARPKLNYSMLRNETYDDFDNDFKTIKKYETPKSGPVNRK